MKTLAVTALAMVGGFAVGIMLSGVIGAVGFLIFDREVGIKYLPIYLAVLGGAAALVVRARFRRRGSGAGGVV